MHLFVGLLVGLVVGVAFGRWLECGSWILRVNGTHHARGKFYKITEEHSGHNERE